MVASLQTPGYDDLELTRSIIEERQGGRNAGYFNAYRNAWLTRITEYVEHRGDPVRIQASLITQDADKQKFINLYSSPAEESAQYPVLRALRGANLLYCPSCGEDGKPGTLDHYLPKDSYPEFALLTKNLTPMCQPCQTKKLAEVLDARGQRQFIHPYFDQIVRPFIRLEITPPFGLGTTFQVGLFDDVQEPARSLYLRHIEALGIAARLEEYCIEKYLQLLRMASELGDPPRRLADALPIMLRMEEKKTHNAWGAIFYRAVMSTPQLLDFLENQELPANI